MAATTAAKRARLWSLSLLGAVVGVAAVGVAFAASAKADFGLSLSPLSGSTAAAGVNQTFTVTMTPNNGYQGTVALNAVLTPVVTSTSHPSGASALLSPASVTYKTSRSGVVVSTTADSVGSWTLKVTGQDGSLSHETLTATFTVTAPTRQFTIAATPPSAQVLPGDVAQYSINITRSATYSSAVTLAATGLPAATTASFSPASPVSGSSTVMQLATTSTTPAGTFTVQITGTGAGATAQSTTVQLVVTSQGKPFSISGNPDPAVELLPAAAGASINLVLSNPNNQTLNITNLTVTVTGTDQGSACGPENFAVTQLDPSVYPLVLAKNGSNVTLQSLQVPQAKWPVVRMLNLDKAQDGCQNAHYLLTYAGAGTG
jgi:hypothetical protein